MDEIIADIANRTGLDAAVVGKAVGIIVGFLSREAPAENTQPVLDKLPGAHQLPPGVAAQVDDRRIVHFEAIINSMTPAERRRPEIINGSRKKRIAAGSGTTIQDVNRLLKQFTQMQKMMKRMSRKGGIANLLRGMGGAFPPGGFPR